MTTVAERIVVIFAEEHDFHAVSVRYYLEKIGVEVLLLDLEAYPSQIHLIHDLENDDYSIEYDGKLITSAQVLGVWVRRPTGISIKSENLSFDDIEFTRLQCLHAIRGWLCTVDNIINPILEDERARYKPYQLKIAQQVGLTIPKTLISNNPLGALSFWKKMNGNVIYKPLAAHRSKFLETRMMSEEALIKLNTLNQGPVIFQECINRGEDYRITVIDDKIFSTRILPTTTEAQLDWRLDDTAKIEKICLPKAEEQRIFSFMGKMGLRYGALDFRRGKDGVLYFFEVNSGGQFLFNDIQAETQIAPALASALAGEYEIEHNKKIQRTV